MTAVNEDGTFAIGYDDGDRELNVPPSLIRNHNSVEMRKPLVTDEDWESLCK